MIIIYWSYFCIDTYLTTAICPKLSRKVKEPRMSTERHRICGIHILAMFLTVLIMCADTYTATGNSSGQSGNKTVDLPKSQSVDSRSVQPDSASGGEDLLGQDLWIDAIFTGIASMENSNYRKLAIQNALWEAVRADLVRRQISVEGIQKNASKIQELIKSAPKGIFQQINMVEDRKNNGQYSVKIKVKFLPDNLGEWMFIGGVDLSQFYKWWGHPSFLVAVEDIIEEQSSGMQRAHIYIQRELLDRGFNVKKGEMQREIRQADAGIFSGGNKKVNLALAREHNSEIIIMGACIETLREKLQLAGQLVYAYDSTLRIEIVDSANADIIASKEWIYHAKIDEHTTAYSTQRAIEKSQKKLLDLYSGSIIYEILHYYFEWKITYELKFLNIKSSDRKRILNCIKSIKDIEFVVDEFDGAIMHIKVKYASDPERIIEDVEKALGFDLQRKTRGLLVFEIATTISVGGDKCLLRFLVKITVAPKKIWQDFSAFQAQH